MNQASYDWYFSGSLESAPCTIYKFWINCHPLNFLHNNVYRSKDISPTGAYLALSIVIHVISKTPFLSSCLLFSILTISFYLFLGIKKSTRDFGWFCYVILRSSFSFWIRQRADHICSFLGLFCPPYLKLLMELMIGCLSSEYSIVFCICASPLLVVEPSLRVDVIKKWRQHPFFILMVTFLVFCALI